MDKLTAAVSVVSGGEVPAGESGESGESLCPALTWRQRLTGCGCCFGAGALFLLLSFAALATASVVSFSVLFSLGNGLSIGGMLFLAGPTAHLKRMFDEGRWIATTVYIVSVILTLVVALLLHNALLVLMLCIIQIFAMLWYILSYIPFARDAVKACLSGIMR